MNISAGCESKIVPYDYSATIEASNALFIYLTSDMFVVILVLIIMFWYGAVSRDPFETTVQWRNHRKP